MYEFNPNNFNKNEMSEGDFELIPVGKYRVRITAANWYTSKSTGKQSIEVILAVSGYKSRLWHYIGVGYSNDEEKRKVDQRIGAFMTNFAIPFEVGLNFDKWVGHAGGANIKHDTYNGKTSAKVAYFIFRENLDKLPAWVDAFTGKGDNPAQSYRQSAGFDPYGNGTMLPDMPLDIRDLDNGEPETATADIPF